ncbi:hypothetical protein ACIBG8_39565 [Nonomuraea sp. NPDC050556]|uniref:hypothetical protein n=1 Tax=Nonomuraea sp. NPDC050556 TaxID=3364369 RepID=UPI0037A39131
MRFLSTWLAALGVAGAVLSMTAVPASAGGRQPVTVSGVRASVDGECPAQVGFTARIRSGRGTVTYRWVRSDGTKGRIQTLRFRHAGVKTVRSRWTIEDDYPGWQAVQVLSPRRFTSQKARFTVSSCTQPPPPAEERQDVRATIKHAVGDCQGAYAAVGLVATVSVNHGPETLRYRWKTSSQDGNWATLSFGQGGEQSKQIEYGSAYKSGEHWAVLEIDGWLTTPRHTFTVTCQEPVTAEAKVDPIPSYDSYCDGGVPEHLRAVVRVTSTPATVRIQWKGKLRAHASDPWGPEDDLWTEQTLTFKAGDPLERAVEADTRVWSPAEYAFALQILAPNRAMSNWSAFSVRCK